VISDRGTAGTDSFGGNSGLLGKQAESDEALGELAIGLFSNEFVAGMASPEIGAAALKKFAGSPAKELNQRCWIGAFRSLGSNTEKQLLESIISGVGYRSPWRWCRIASCQIQSVTAG
jgi:hypothetical protein